MIQISNIDGDTIFEYAEMCNLTCQTTNPTWLTSNLLAGMALRVNTNKAVRTVSATIINYRRALTMYSYRQGNEADMLLYIDACVMLCCAIMHL